MIWYMWDVFLGCPFVCSFLIGNGCVEHMELWTVLSRCHGYFWQLVDYRSIMLGGSKLGFMTHEEETYWLTMVAKAHASMFLSFPFLFSHLVLVLLCLHLSSLLTQPDSSLLVLHLTPPSLVCAADGWMWVFSVSVGEGLVIGEQWALWMIISRNSWLWHHYMVYDLWVWKTPEW